MADNVRTLAVGTVQDLEHHDTTQSRWGCSAAKTLIENSTSTPLRHLPQLQKRILRWLAADHHRTHGVILSSHAELVKALGGYKGNTSRSLQTLERRGLIV